jgi:hypothetical protein
MAKPPRFACSRRRNPRRVGSPKQLAPVLDRDTIELLAGFFAIVTFGVVLILIQQ